MKKETNLAQLKEEEIDARLSAKCAKVVWQELVREWEMLHRAVARIEGKVLVCVVLVILVGGCANTFQGFGRFVGGIGQDIEQAATGYENETNK